MDGGAPGGPEMTVRTRIVVWAERVSDGSKSSQRLLPARNHAMYSAAARAVSYSGW
jgi:hypothetical protein